MEKKRIAISYSDFKDVIIFSYIRQVLLHVHSLKIAYISKILLIKSEPLLLIKKVNG